MYSTSDNYFIKISHNSMARDWILSISGAREQCSIAPGEDSIGAALTSVLWLAPPGQHAHPQQTLINCFPTPHCEEKQVSRMLPFQNLTHMRKGFEFRKHLSNYVVPKFGRGISKGLSPTAGYCSGTIKLPSLSEICRSCCKPAMISLQHISLPACFSPLINSHYYL